MENKLKQVPEPHEFEQLVGGGMLGGGPVGGEKGVGDDGDGGHGVSPGMNGGL